jgi:DNA polymerase-3 subunit delta'
MGAGMIYPWQEQTWARLYQRFADKQLPHALLLTGHRGLGKLQFARHLAATALCEAPEPAGPCGHCQSCHLVKAGTHPDLFLLQPEEAGKQIRIDRVRELIEFINLSSRYGRAKLALIEPADAMNMASANSLLKTLEEPPSGTLLILVTAQPHRLPITIRSRCQVVDFQDPGLGQSIAWLQEEQVIPEKRAVELLAIAHGAPLYASELAEAETLQIRNACFQDALEVLRGKLPVSQFSARYEKELSSQLLQWILSWLEDLVRLGLDDQGKVRNPDLIQDLQRLSKVLDLQDIYKLQDRLYDYLRFHGRVNLNSQMVLEDIMFNWQSALRLGKGRN